MEGNPDKAKEEESPITCTFLVPIASRWGSRSTLITIGRVRLLVTARRWSRVRVTTIIVYARGRIRVVYWRTTGVSTTRRRGAIAAAMITLIVIMARWRGATTVSRITTWAVVAGRKRVTTVVVASTAMRRRIATTSRRWRAGTIAIVVRNFGLSLPHMSGELPTREGSWQTSAVQRTLEPLKSELSNFSTAIFKSAAVSNSTKLSRSVKFLCSARSLFTLYHRGHDQPRSRPRRGRNGEQNLSNPMASSKS